ncbi:MAG: DNA-binding protein WhiA [Lachnospiraceae bacterium]|nr:DNA-binding protein WhiA [Lachnospiraceae bacterium]
MSFSQDVKQEIAGKLPQGKKAELAYLAAMFMQCARRGPISDGAPYILFHTENFQAARICFTLTKKLFNIEVDVSARTSQIQTYLLKIPDSPELTESLCINGNMDALDLSGQEEKKAFLTGAFLCTGSVSDPSLSYHLEIVCSSGERASLLRSLASSFGMKAGVVRRKNHEVFYLKDGSQIVDMLGIMDAHVSLMNMENSRIVRDMRNSINRRVNCEAANIRKTVSASVRQVEDIRFLEQAGVLREISPKLRQIADARLDNPDLPLKDLGEMLDPPVGKSGVNHRLRKLSELADRIRKDPACRIS